MKKSSSDKKKLAYFGGEPVRKTMPQQIVVAGREEADAVAKVIASGRISALSNDIVEEFEKDFATYTGTKHAVAVNSGTAALHVALAALGVGPGDEVIVPPYTFIATASAVIQQNAVPVFADIDSATLNIDPAQVERKITKRVKAIIPVHLFGLPAAMKELNRIGRKHGVPIIEDACQAHGATYGGKKVGSIGDMGCFSLQESKNITAGEGGVITTDSDKLAKQCRIIRHIGMAAKYQYVTLGYNYRLTAMGAAFAKAQLGRIDEFNAHRRGMADIYREGLRGLPLEMIAEPDGSRSAYHLFPVTLSKEVAPTAAKMKKIHAMITAENVPASWVYPRSLNEVDFIKNKKAHGKKCPFDCPHRQAPAKYEKGQCPASDDVTARTLVLFTAPCYSQRVARDTVKAIKKVLRYETGV